MKYQSLAPSGCKDIGLRRFEFVAKTQFLCTFLVFLNYTSHHKNVVFLVYFYGEQNNSRARGGNSQGANCAPPPKKMPSYAPKNKIGLEFEISPLIVLMCTVWNFLYLLRCGMYLQGHIFLGRIQNMSL